MGVYIPPPGDNDGKGSKNSKTPNNNNNNNSDITKPITSPPSPPGSTTIVIPNPAALIPHNPSIGLFWGPLTPAPDNLPAFYGMIGLQFLLGVGSLRYARQIVFKPRILSAPNQYQPRIRGSILRALAPTLGGVVAIFGSGLELARLSLPYDPWYEEAKYYRRLATKNGDSPSSWFGAYKYYKPLDLNTWIERTGAWIKNIDSQIEDSEINEIFGNNHQNSHVSNNDKDNGNDMVVNAATKAQRASSRLIAKLNKDNRYLDIYQKLKETNNKRYVSLLDHDLKDVNELNKAERIDLILEGKSPYVNPSYTKSHIQLGKFSIESDDDFDRAWLNFEPWDELKLETEYEIRLIPHWGGPDNASPIVDASQSIAEGDDIPTSENSTNSEVDSPILT